ncbi:hypothetical protein CDD82_7158 [Ophiocordyceps australis]|uniref:Vacuolar ATPase assembly integral membrane protein VMA21 n=1 Tax=Ophiocordyceps australis TaxID=1399860 RepID=A0A2C5YS00_9HYPO|nr:hypothetical protein CDD82_7158 [Ophiocordyceps australis]
MARSTAAIRNNHSQPERKHQSILHARTMATRRIISSEKSLVDHDHHQPEQKSNITPAVPTHVIVKLLAFTFAMIVVPIGSYFLTVNSLFKGMIMSLSCEPFLRAFPARSLCIY